MKSGDCSRVPLRFSSFSEVEARNPTIAHRSRSTNSMFNSLLGRSFASVLAPYANPTDEIINALHNRDSSHALQILRRTPIQDLDVGILYNGNTLLHIACYYNAIEIVVELIILKVNVNSLSSAGISLSSSLNIR